VGAAAGPNLFLGMNIVFGANAAFNPIERARISQEIAAAERSAARPRFRPRFARRNLPFSTASASSAQVAPSLTQPVNDREFHQRPSAGNFGDPGCSPTSGGTDSYSRSRSYNRTTATATTTTTTASRPGFGLRWSTTIGRLQLVRRYAN
jgi:hypothetical protein